MRHHPWLFAAALLSPAAAFAAPAIIDPGQGPVPLLSGTTAAGGLSGITHSGGGEFRFVGDNGGFGGRAIVPVDPVTGAIAGASVTLAEGYTYAGRTDLEALAIHPLTGEALVSDEAGNTLTRYPASGGAAATGMLAVPPIYDTARGNLGLESLAIAPDGTTWTANEEALTPDGTTGPGSLVRIQRFDADGQPSGQWAHQTGGALANAGFTNNSGLVDLAVLPDGRVLALERAVGLEITELNIGGVSTGEYRFRNRVLLLDFSAVTDVSGEASLATPGSPFTTVTATELWSAAFSDHNFEGLTLGESLDTPGEYSLLLVSDNDTFPAVNQNVFVTMLSVPQTPVGQSLYALRLTGIPEPTTAAMLCGSVVGLALGRPRAADRDRANLTIE